MADYELTERRDGFTIVGRPHPCDKPGEDKWFVDMCYSLTGGRRTPVTVTRRATHFVVEETGEQIGLYEYRWLVARAAEVLMRQWQPDYFEWQSSPWRGVFEPYGGEFVAPVARRQSFDIWYETEFGPPQHYTPEVEAVCRARCERLAFGVPASARERREAAEYRRLIYGPQEWAGVRAWAVGQTRRAIGRRVHAQWRRLLGAADPTVTAVQRNVFASTFGYSCNPILFDPELYSEKYIVRDLMAYRAAACLFARTELSLEHLSHWREMFAPEGAAPYGALNKTLNKLPGGIPAPLLSKLNQVLLPRPITRRLELLVTLLAGEHRSPHFDVFARATGEQIKEAMNRISRSLNRAEPLRHRRVSHVAVAVQYLNDFPEAHSGNLVGLTNKAIRWHRTDRQHELRQHVVATLGADTPTARPPVPLPDLPGIRFLTTVGEVADEGRLMHHCIASYAERATNGQ